MNRVWQGILGLISVGVFASGCIAVYDWDFEAGSGGDAGNSSCPGCTYGRRFGDDSSQHATDIALADDGSAFVVGTNVGLMELDATHSIDSSAAGGGQPFLFKLNRTGQTEYITRPLDFQSSIGSGLQIAVAGNVFAWTSSVSSGASNHDTVVEMRDVGGGRDATRWRKVFGASNDDALRSVALSHDGKRLYLAGGVPNTNEMFTNCPALQPFDSAGKQNLVVLAIDAENGSCLWGKSWGGGHHLGGSISVVTGSDGAPFVSGQIYEGTIANNEGISIPPAPPQVMDKFRATAFILKLDPSTGALLAGRGYVNAGFISMTSDRSTGTIIASGGAGGDVTFLGKTTTGAPDAGDAADGLIFGFDENLNEKWAQFPAGPSNQVCFSVESDGQGRVYAACLTSNKLDRNVVVNCSTDRMCGVLFPLQSSTGTFLGNKIKTFGETQSAANMGLTFLTAATPDAVAVVGSWTAPVRFWDDVLLDVTGSSGDFDVAVGKVEPLP